MGVDVQLVGTSEVRNYLDDMPERLFKEAKKAFGSVAASAHQKISARIRDGAGGTLHSRTGQLRRSMQFNVTGTKLDDLGASVFSEKSVAKYALLHEYGGTITAKNAYHTVPGGPYLNIPSKENKTASGVQRLSARQVFNADGYIRPIGNGRYAVFQDGIPMFWLVKSVTIPARLKMVETATGEVPTLLSKLRDATQTAIQ